MSCSEEFLGNLNVAYRNYLFTLVIELYVKIEFFDSFAFWLLFPTLVAERGSSCAISVNSRRDVR